MRKIIHIDMDCFYAAIEMRDNPSLANKPIAVGGPADSRSVLCTSNYVARKYGVHSAMPSAYAKRLCPQLIILPVNMQKYREASTIIRKIFFEYTDLVEPLSLDEAYLDVSACDCFHNSATLIARKIREQIFTACQLTASAGIAPNKFLAKVASDLDKPNGQHVITPDNISQFIKALPVNKIFGVGKITSSKLEKMGITTCLQLQTKTYDELTTLFGKFGSRLYELSRGIDNRPVNPSRTRKSLSVENTFAKDLLSLEACIAQLPDLFNDLNNRLTNKKTKTEDIHKQFIKIKFNNFKTTTVEMTSNNVSFELFQKLLTTGFHRKSLPVRLLGVGVGFKAADEKLQHEFALC